MVYNISVSEFLYSPLIIFLINLLSDKECIYNNSYQDLFNNTINFSEFKIKD